MEQVRLQIMSSDSGIINRSRDRSRKRSRSQSNHNRGRLSRLSCQVERERQTKIERENQILLKKILDCHHGVDRRRTSSIPPSMNSRGRSSPMKTSNQVNQERRREKTDYENLILLAKIQNVKPSQTINKSFKPAM